MMMQTLSGEVKPNSGQTINGWLELKQGLVDGIEY